VSLSAPGLSRYDCLKVLDDRLTLPPSLTGADAHTLERRADLNEVSNPKVDWTKIDTQIEHEGRQIKLPADPGKMDYDIAIDTIARVRDQENQEFDVSELVKGAPWDTLVAVYKAMQQIYGVVIAQSQHTFFGEIKPDFVTVHTGPGNHDRVQVPMGQMALPGVKAPVNVSLQYEGTRISGTVRRRDRAILVEIANLARDIVKRDSVYRAKAIRLNVDDDGDLNLHQQPEFLDLAQVRETDMIHTRDTEAQIRTSLLAPLKHTAACRRNKVPLKRGILLEGRYGTGKSLTARVTAKVATENGWTFVMLNRAQGLKNAIEFARNYQPCVIFAEDIDRAADREDEGVNDLVNLLDGMITKDMEMMVVLTTNFIEKIDRALLRPGRFDAIISIDQPDAETAIRIIRAYGGALLDQATDLDAIGDLVSGMIPASIREVVERAKLGMLTEGRVSIEADDLRTAAVGMQKHMRLLDPPEAAPSHADNFAQGFIGMIGDSLFDTDGLATTVDVETARAKTMMRLDHLAKGVKASLDISRAGAAAAEGSRINTEKLLSKGGK
jgi:hypothetical protein